MNSIILASGSQRRADILRRLDIPFIMEPQDVDETFAGRDPLEESVRLACEKLNSLLSTCRSAPPWVLAADTFILCRGTCIGKPADRREARSMLSALSGTEHKVITGLALYSSSHGVSTAVSETKVYFGLLTAGEIDIYLDTEEWRDAAGAYRIQEKGELLVERIEGSYSNVMGLPIRTFYGMLMQHEYPFPSPG